MKNAIPILLLIAAVVLASLIWWMARPEAKTEAGRPAATSSGSTMVSATARPDSSAESKSEATNRSPSRALAPVTRELEPIVDPASPPFVRVSIVSKDTGAPVANARVFAASDVNQSVSWQGSPRPHARIGELAQTDDSGVAELEVVPNTKIRISVAQLMTRKEYSREVEPMPPGGVCDVQIEIPTEPDLTLFGRLVDEGTGVPIAGGVVRSIDRSRMIGATQPGPEYGDSTSVGVDGVFQLQVRSWKERFAEANVDGYSRTYFVLDPSHDTRESAVDIRVRQSATVVAVIVDANEPVVGAELVFACDAHQLRQEDEGFDPSRLYFASEQVTWRGSTDTNGVALVTELPAGIPLEMSIKQIGRPTRREPRTMALEPGETRRVVTDIGANARIMGRIQTSTGHPIGNAMVRMDVFEGFAPVLLRDNTTPVAIVQADRDGRFEIVDVPVGDWLVGPAAQRSSSGSAIPPLSQRVTVEPGDQRVELVLQCDVGLMISGTLLNEHGEPAARGWIEAKHETLDVSVVATAGETGDFSIGPLPAGTYLVRAESLGGKQGASSEVRRIEAPAGDVELQLRRGGTVLVRVFDQQGLPANASVTIRPVNRFDTWSFTSTKNGECEFECLEAATYIVCASTNQGLFAHSGRLVIDAGKVMGPVDLRLALGAKLRVQYDGDQSARTYRVIVEGTTCARDKIARGTTRTFIVPCGEIELQAEAEQLAPATSQRFVVSPGEERYVTVR